MCWLDLSHTSCVPLYSANSPTYGHQDFLTSLQLSGLSGCLFNYPTFENFDAANQQFTFIWHNLPIFHAAVSSHPRRTKTTSHTHANVYDGFYTSLLLLLLKLFAQLYLVSHSGLYSPAAISLFYCSAFYCCIILLSQFFIAFTMDKKKNSFFPHCAHGKYFES